jgi:hypothetical protein
MFCCVDSLGATCRSDSKRYGMLIAFVRSTAPRADGRLPYHMDLACPHSPTMDSGAREWHVAEGDSFIAGDALAQIDTDKASMDFKRKTMVLSPDLDSGR